MALDPQSASWKTIITAIANQVISVVGVDSSCVRVVASDKYDLYVNSIGDQGFLIRYFGPEYDTDGGGGRGHRRVQRLVRVHIWIRNSSDQAGEDVTALLQDGGLSDVEEQVENALDEFWPMSTAQTPAPLTIEPLHPLNSAEGPPERKAEDDIGWIHSYLDYSVSYVSINATPQP